MQSGKWTAEDAGVGPGVDSYYEYLLKGAILFQSVELMEMFEGTAAVINVLFLVGLHSNYY